jgi:hypothetical protein
VLCLRNSPDCTSVLRLSVCLRRCRCWERNKIAPSVRPSVRMHKWNHLKTTKWIFVNFNITAIKFWLKCDKCHLILHVQSSVRWCARLVLYWHVSQRRCLVGELQETKSACFVSSWVHFVIRGSWFEGRCVQKCQCLCTFVDVLCRWVDASQLGTPRNKNCAIEVE